MVRMHSSEGFYALDDPLEAAIFSMLIELMKELEKRKWISDTIKPAMVSGQALLTKILIGFAALDNSSDSIL